jgi:hypothetical protein
MLGIDVGASLWFSGATIIPGVVGPVVTASSGVSQTYSMTQQGRCHPDLKEEKILNHMQGFTADVSCSFSTFAALGLHYQQETLPVSGGNYYNVTFMVLSSDCAALKLREGAYGE